MERSEAVVGLIVLGWVVWVVLESADAYVLFLLLLEVFLLVGGGVE